MKAPNANPIFFVVISIFLMAAGLKNICTAAVPLPIVSDNVRDVFVPIVPDTNNYSSYLGQRMKINAVDRMINHYNKYKLVDALLKAFEQRPGAQTWAGEHPCKYLDALTRAWMYSKAPELKVKMDSVALRLIKSQLSNGYSGTYLPANYWTAWDVWAQAYYLIGLETYYCNTGDTNSLNACKKAANLLCNTFGPSPLRDLSKSSSDHMGMPSTIVLEPIVMLYRYTGDVKYLNFANYIIGLLDGSGQTPIVANLENGLGVNAIGDAKAYEMTGNMVGVADYYRMTGQARYLDACVKDWTDIMQKRHYITGTSSWGEIFRANYDLPGDNGTATYNGGGVGESCFSTTWLQLNWHLFRLTGEAKYADEMEKIVYNALLAAQRPKKGHNTLLNDSCIGDICYFTPLVNSKPYGLVSHIVDDISCCSSSQIRGIALIAQMMLGVTNNMPTIVLYTPAKATLPITVNGTAVKVGIDIATTYPEDGNVVVTLNPSTSANFTLHLRVPSWCTYYQVNALGKKYMGTKGTFLDVTDKWSPGDKVQIYMYMSYQTIPGGSGMPLGQQYGNNVAVQRGPQVLATDNSISSSTIPANWVGGLLFSVPGIRSNQAIQFNMVPYSDAGQDEENFTVYMNTFAIDTTKLPPINPPTLVMTNSPTGNMRPGLWVSPLTKNGYSISVKSNQSHTVAILAPNGALKRLFRGNGNARYPLQGLSSGVYLIKAEIDKTQYMKEIIINK